MRIDRRLVVGGVIALLVIAVLPDAMMLRLAAVGGLLVAAAGYAAWLADRGEWARHDRPASDPDDRLADVLSARIGEPVAAAAPFLMRVQQGPGERWMGEELVWIVISDSALWLLHRGVNGTVGGVKSRFLRDQLHTCWIDHRWQSHHVAELSWPADPWFIRGELHGPRAQRLRLIGLLAGDELGVRDLVTRGEHRAL